MQLIIIDHADPSVGLQETTYRVDVPFDKNSDKEILEMFKNSILHSYAMFCFGKMTLLYDFEAEAIGKSFSDYGLNNG
ncbi:MAG TPA: hypothetical protein PK079_23900 [Leptospiraceae bacterium]|nr:hypothetical protein [Leptospiraceae bacterium]HNC59783.1 hypothetical protein [Leptospiraceae bacterium]HNE56228.1 hypothetical protein [Leptospiraceae bacterium]HNF57566.1 hypothetical protein [Leptospiraceae bacterium]HNM92128.1 hypothetical protein [Leptospiraceae bacterium]